MHKLPIVSIEKTGSEIRKLRKDNNITVKELQYILGVTPNAIYKWETGKCLPNIDNLVILASIFNTTIDDIIQLEE